MTQSGGEVLVGYAVTRQVAVDFVMEMMGMGHGEHEDSSDHGSENQRGKP